MNSLETKELKLYEASFVSYERNICCCWLLNHAEEDNLGADDSVQH